MTTLLSIGGAAAILLAGHFALRLIERRQARRMRDEQADWHWDYEP